jgi:hypothetical protein
MAAGLEPKISTAVVAAVAVSFAEDQTASVFAPTCITFTLVHAGNLNAFWRKQMNLPG